MEKEIKAITVVRSRVRERRTESRAKENGEGKTAEQDKVLQNDPLLNDHLKY